MTTIQILAGSLALGFFIYVLLKFHEGNKKLSTQYKYSDEKTNVAETDPGSSSAQINSDGFPISESTVDNKRRWSRFPNPIPKRQHRRGQAA